MILQDVHKGSQFYNVQSYETQDAGNIKQLTVRIRYVNCTGGVSIGQIVCIKCSSHTCGYVKSLFRVLCKELFVTIATIIFVVGNICEQFIGYMDVSGKTLDEELAGMLEKSIRVFELDMSKLRGQCYDGAGIV